MESKKTEFQLSIINKLKTLREQHHLSQMQISEILGLNSSGQIGNIESPKFKHRYTFRKVAHTLTHSLSKIPNNNFFMLKVI